jgi:hypothetical protein
VAADDRDNAPGIDWPEMAVCPADECDATEGLWVMECAPGHTWMFVNDCGHWGFIHKKGTP